MAASRLLTFDEVRGVLQRTQIVMILRATCWLVVSKRVAEVDERSNQTGTTQHQ